MQLHGHWFIADRNRGRRRGGVIRRLAEHRTVEPYNVLVVRVVVLDLEVVGVVNVVFVRSEVAVRHRVVVIVPGLVDVLRRQR